MLGTQKPLTVSQTSTAWFWRVALETRRPQLKVTWTISLWSLWRGAPERSGPCRESDGAGFPPGTSPRGAAHRQADPVRRSVGMPRPRTHHRRFAQLQRPFLHTPGRCAATTDMKADIKSGGEVAHFSTVLQSSSWLVFFIHLEYLRSIFFWGGFVGTACLSFRVKRRWQTWGEGLCPETQRVTTSLLFTPSR